ncbi:MAG: hypothetical protein DMG88_18915 [Acidobacteria bacterium]|nr:MAG: hypothetical protein DMG88_18915 [Acidobacteriota bacterium]
MSVLIEIYFYLRHLIEYTIKGKSSSLIALLVRQHSTFPRIKGDTWTLFDLVGSAPEIGERGTGMSEIMP